jgi:hypothetical protein
LVALRHRETPVDLLNLTVTTSLPADSLPALAAKVMALGQRSFHSQAACRTAPGAPAQQLCAFLLATTAGAGFRAAPEGAPFGVLSSAKLAGLAVSADMPAGWRPPGAAYAQEAAPRAAQAPKLNSEIRGGWDLALWDLVLGFTIVLCACACAAGAGVGREAGTGAQQPPDPRAWEGPEVPPPTLRSARRLEASRTGGVPTMLL